jgi:hypothetical protein
VIVDSDSKRRPPSAEQIAAYAFLKAHDQAVHDAIIRHVFEQYPVLGEQSSMFNEALDLDPWPTIESPHQLRTNIGLGNVIVHRVSRDGVAYVGFEMGCTWDVEHGLGVMMHQSRVIEFGGADTAILEWVAEKDRGSAG